MPGEVESNSNLVKFDPNPIAVDRTWGLNYTRPDGVLDVVSGFTSEIDARAWLSSDQCDQWLEERGFTRVISKIA